jgi:hypothetical protein
MILISPHYPAEIRVFQKTGFPENRFSEAVVFRARAAPRSLGGFVQKSAINRKAGCVSLPHVHYKA